MNSKSHPTYYVTTGNVYCIVRVAEIIKYVVLSFYSVFVVLGSRYVSKTATKTVSEFEYDTPSMKTAVPGPKSQVQSQHFYSFTMRFITRLFCDRCFDVLCVRF